MICQNSKCNKEFHTTRSFQKYCNSRCASAARLKDYEVDPFSCGEEISPSNKGAFSEMIACADLIRKGYDVFRAVSPASPCDIVAIKDNIILRIEVRTARRYRDGALSHFTCHKDGPARSDIYMVVLGSEVLYFNNNLESVDLI